MMKTKDAYRQAMRNELLAAAQAVVARDGLAGLTIRAVLAEADVSPATLYAYFQGKDDLLAAMAEKIVGRLVDSRSIDSITESGDVANALLWALLEDAYAEPIEGAELLADFRGQVGTVSSDRIRDLNSEVVAGMRPLVEQVRRSGGLDVDDFDAFVELLDLVWDGLTRRSASNTFVTSYQRIGKVLLDLIRPVPDDVTRRNPTS